MAKGKKIDANRFRKTYPYIRKIPRFTYLMDADMKIETAELIFTASDEETYTFTEVFTSVPHITVTAIDDNVNIYVSSVNLLSVTVNASAPFTGKCHIHAIEIG